MVTNVWRCPRCDYREETVGEFGEQRIPPMHCGGYMVRDYRAESAGVSFKGGGWARRSK